MNEIIKKSNFFLANIEIATCKFSNLYSLIIKVNPIKTRNVIEGNRFNN